jgi:S-adenosylmethionine:tRNA ribosyltransferase-isomerase
MRTQPLRTEDFDYDLPAATIAQQPIEPRDSARLLVALNGQTADRHVRDFSDFLRPTDVVVLNDTKVLPARIRAQRSSGGSAEVLLLEDRGAGVWEALVRPSRRLPPGSVLRSRAGGIDIEMGRDLGNGLREVRLADGTQTLLGERLLAALERAGEMPLPPYLHGVLGDPGRYQTVFARRPASAAAPTAGLHLTDELLARVADTVAAVVSVELVVGLGTFRPISAEFVEDHEMHREQYRIEAEVWDTICGAERVVAVGTTALRAIESAAAGGELCGSTDLFITPGYPWARTDVLLTNFHLPRSSLLVLVEAFCGPRWRALYRHAIDHGYRMLSFGDAMLVDRA